MSRKVVAAVALTIAVFALGCASEVKREFKLDWQLSEGPGGWSVKGHILNPFALAARDIRLLVEGLDASGGVTTTTLGYLPIIVPSRSGASFDVPVPATAVSYRVRVLSYEWVLPPASPARNR